MAISFTRPDPSSPASVSEASFGASRRGFDQNEVREFLRMVAAELARLQERQRFLERELRTAQQRASGEIELDDDTVTRMLGEETTRILQTARETSSQIKIKAEEGAARLLREATDEAQRVREEAEVEAARRRADAGADAEAELSMAKQQGREMVNEARAYRERVLSELARRREVARQQIEQLIHGRDRLIQVFERARLVAVDVISDLTPLGSPDEYVNLDPTTGPVPLMVPASALRATVVDVDLGAIEFVPDADAAAPAAEVDEVDVEAAATSEAGADHRSNGSKGDGADRTVDVVGALIELPPSIEPDAGDDLADRADGTDGDVVALFPDAPKPSVDDLFARLRAEADTATDATADAAADAATDPVIDLADEGVAAEGAAGADVDDAVETPFSRRDAELVPLIVSAARKLKRVLADEQNEVLDTLRRKEPVRTLDSLVPWESDHSARYAAAIADELKAAAMAGAASVSDAGVKAHRGDINRRDALGPVHESLTATLVAPLRERLSRCLDNSDGDNTDVAKRARSVYREWKTQRIDEQLDDLLRLSYGRGAYAALDPGVPVRWLVDPAGPACPDAEDNALAGPTPAGSPFPTGNECAPAHAGCRCVLERADR